MGTRPRRFVQLTWMMWLAFAVGAGLTAIAIVFPGVRFAYRNPPMHVMLETAEGGAALLAAYLIAGRFRQRRAQADLILCTALTLLGLTNIFSALVPTFVTPRLEPFTQWFPLTVRTLGGGLVALAALSSLRTVRDPERVARAFAVALTGVVVAVALAFYAVVDRLPLATVAGAVPDAARPSIEGHPLLLASQYVVTVLYVVAAYGFSRRATRHEDQMLEWIAAGCILAAFARVNYFLYPSLYTDLVYLGDFLRFGFYTFVAIGASREIRAYWHTLADAAVLQERNRIAGSLHDGLAQELVFVAAHASRLERGKDPDPPEGLRQLRSASTRAVAEARRAIKAMTRPVGEPLDVALREFAEEVAPMRSALFELDLAEGVTVESVAKEGVLRIVREAVANALRHAEPSRIVVRLVQDDSVRVEVIDDGVGFDPGAESRTGRFGLVTMEEGARRIGADIEISSTPGLGTSVRVMLPSKT